MIGLIVILDGPAAKILGERCFTCQEIGFTTTNGPLMVIVRAAAFDSPSRCSLVASVYKDESGDMKVGDRVEITYNPERKTGTFPKLVSV